MTLSAGLFILDALQIRVMALLLSAQYDKLFGFNTLVLSLQLKCPNRHLKRLLFCERSLRLRFLGLNLVHPGPWSLVARWTGLSSGTVPG